MRITLLTIGKSDIPWVKQGLDMYVSRLKHYASFELIEIPELKGVKALSQEQIKQKEGELALKYIKPGDSLILLDERGSSFRSLEFARFLEDRMARSSSNIIFLIGGAYGFSPAVYERSQSSISLSKMTFSHQLVRTIFAEQLYRAFTIIKGEPYHHE